VSAEKNKAHPPRCAYTLLLDLRPRRFPSMEDLACPSGEGITVAGQHGIRTRFIHILKERYYIYLCEIIVKKKNFQCVRDGDGMIGGRRLPWSAG